MNHHAARLVDDDHILIFIQDIEGDILCVNRNFLGRRYDTDNFFAAAQLIVCLAYRPIHRDQGRLNETLDVAAREIGLLSREKAIQALIHPVGDVGFAHERSSFFWTKSAQRTAAVPRTMAISATLNTGHTRKSKKSTTCPSRMRSIRLLTAPAASATLP